MLVGVTSMYQNVVVWSLAGGTGKEMNPQKGWGFKQVVWVQVTQPVVKLHQCNSKVNPRATESHP